MSLTNKENHLVKKYLLCLMALLLLACQPKQKKVPKELIKENITQKAENAAANQPLKVLDKFVVHNEKCRTFDQQKYCDSVRIETDLLNNQSINNYIYQTVTGQEQTLNGNLKTAFNRFNQQQLAELDERYQKEGNQIHPYAEIRYDSLHLITNTPQLAFFRHSYIEYRGGAHPSTQVYNLVIDKNTTQDIVLDQLLLPKAEEKLLQLQKDALLQTLINKISEYDLSADAPSVDDLKKMIEEWRIKLSTNWGFDDNNLWFTYSPYETAANKYGIININIPKEKLTEIIQPQYLQLIFEHKN